MNVVALGLRLAAGGTPGPDGRGLSRLGPDDVVVVDGEGHRLRWKHSQQAPYYKVRGLLPGPEQQRRLAAFLQAGGTIATFAADPAATIRIPILAEEADDRSWGEGIRVEIVDEGLLEVVLQPFDWLLPELLPLARAAFEYLCQGGVVDALSPQPLAPVGWKGHASWKRPVAVTFQNEAGGRLAFLDRRAVLHMGERGFLNVLGSLSRMEAGIARVG